MIHNDAASRQTIPLTAMAAIGDQRRQAAGIAIVLIAQFATLVALLWIVLGVVMAHAGEADGRQGRLLAYAEPLTERFAAPFTGQSAFDADVVEGGHPLNDAWMGLNVVTSDGQIAGYVSDAFIGPDGAVDEIIVTPPQEGALAQPVYVPAGQTTFSGAHVQVSATLAALSGYEPVAESFAALPQ